MVCKRMREGTIFWLFDRCLNNNKDVIKWTKRNSRTRVHCFGLGHWPTGRVVEEEVSTSVYYCSCAALVLVATAALLALVSRSRVRYVNVDDVIVWQVTTLTERSDYNNVFLWEIRSYHFYRLLHFIYILTNTPTTVTVLCANTIET